MQPVRSTLAALLTLALALTAVPSIVMAQEDAARHPLVGAWVLDATPDDPSDAVDLVIFDSDGTLISLSVQGPAVGSWEPTGERTADVTFHSLGIAPDGSFGGLFTIRASGEVAADDQTLAATYTLEPPAAMVEMMGLPQGQLGPGEVTARRIDVDAMGEPVGPIPDFSELMPSAQE